MQNSEFVTGWSLATPGCSLAGTPGKTIGKVLIDGKEVKYEYFPKVD